MSDCVAVIGAGPMGLAAAYQLLKDGHKPIVFEADDRIGGMSAAFDFDGTSIERYYHFHCTSDMEFLKILKELGIEEKMNWVETKMGYWYKGKLQPWGNPVALLKFSGLSLIAKIRYGLHTFLCTKRNNWKPLDTVEATGWLRRWVGKEAYEVLWRRLFEFKFYQYQTHLSAAWIWSRIRRIGRSRYNLFREKLGFLEGGSETLLQAMARYIESHGGQIRLKTPVQKVCISNNKIAGVCVGGETLSFNRVISTIPIPYVPKLIPDLPPAIKSQYSSVKNIGVVCVIVKLNKPISPNFWLNVNDPDMDIPGLVEYTNLRPMGKHIVYIPFYMPTENKEYREPDSVFVNKVKSYLKRINPELTDEDFKSLYVNRYHFAQPICPPSFLEKLPPVKLPIDGLWVADTSYYYPEDRGISESIGFGRKLAKGEGF